MSTTTDRAAETILAVRWPDGSLDGLPSSKVIGMLAHALAEHDLLATSERDAEHRRAGAVEALRQAADHMAEDPALVDVVTWLRERADRIKAQR